MNDELKKLYDALSSKGYYTKSFDEFVGQYQDESYRDKLFGVVSRDGLYTKSREEFDAKYPAQPLKKKETSEVSSQEEPLASPMETPTLDSLPGRDATLPPSPTLAPQLAQTLERIAPMDKVEAEVAMTTGAAFEQPEPTQEQFPVPYETRPTEVVTEEGITMDLETGAIAGEEGISPEAQAAMETRIEEGAVEMPQAPVGEGVQAAQEYLDKLERQRIDELKENYKRFVGIDELAMAGANLVSMLYPSGLPGSEFIDRTASEMTQAYLENAGLTPEETRKSFSEQDSFEKGAIKFGVDVMNAMALSALAASTMGTTALAGVGTAETFGLAAGAEAAGVSGLLQNALKTVTGNIAKNPLNFGLMGHVGSNMAWKEVKDNPNMSTEEKVAYATFSGIKEMLTEAGFVGDFRAWNESLSMAERAAAKNTFKEIMKDYSSNLAKQGLEEGAEEGISWSGDLIWNLLSGEELPSARSGWEAMAVGAVAPASSVTAQYAPAIADYAAGAVLPYTLPKSENLAKLSDLKAKSSQIQKDIDAEGVSEEEKGRLLQAKKQVDDEISNLRSEAIKERESMSIQDQISLATIDAQVEKLYDEFSKAKTGSAKAIIKQEVKSLLDSKRKIEQGDAIQKQTAGKVPVQPEAAVGEEVAEGAPQAEPQVAPEAGVEEEVVLTPQEEAEKQRLAETISAPTKAKADIETITRETISTGRKVADNVVVNEVRAEGKPSKPSMTERVAVRAGKAIKRLFPDVNIVLHATADEYVRHAQDAVATDRGEYNPNTNTININLATADATTVAHEVFHAVFINRLKTDKKTREVARQMIAAVRKSLPKDSELAKEIDDFAQNYDENFQDEERLAQLVGILAKSYANLKPTAKEQVIDFIKRLAKSLGISLPKNFGTTDKSVMDMLDVLARKVATGRQLMEEDIAFVEESTYKKAKGKSRKQIDVTQVRSSNRPGSKVGRGLSKVTRNKQPIYSDSDQLSVQYVRENAPDIYIKNAEILRKYPVVRGVKKFGVIDSVKKADAVYEIFVQEVADNLLYLHDVFNPELREAATLWYDGANQIANEMANKYGVSPEQVAGVIASLSPQKDWYQNVRLAELVFEAFEKNPSLTQEMVEIQKGINEEGIKRARKKGPKQEQDAAKRAQDAIDLISQYVGQSLNEAPDYIKPFIVRLSNEASGEKDYNILAPDGRVVGAATKGDGDKARLAWGSYTEIGKAVSIKLNGSPEAISRALGEMHKIRNFYNNIIDPMSTDGDVTIDTHAVAAGLLMPVAGKSAEVKQNFGTGSSSSGAKGIKGLYYAFSDAYARAAEQRGLLPRQMQSITWEAIRTMMSDTFKSNKSNVKKVMEMHNDYVRGLITKDELRRKIENETGGIKNPAWAGLVLSVRDESAGARAEREGVRGAERTPEWRINEDSLPIAELTDNQKAALDEFDAKKKPAVRKQKAVSNEEARASLEKKLQKLFPTDTDDALTPDELRVFFMENNFEYFKGEDGIGSYEQTAKVLMDMASQEGVYLFPSFSLRGAFMFADLANGGESIDMNIMLSPGLLQGPDGMQGDYVDVQAIEAIDPGDRGSGAGTRLMNRLVDSADNVGAKLRLEAYPTKRYQVDPVTKKKISQSALNKTARRLVGFYERFGFSPYGRTKYYDFQQMRREPLEPGGRTASIRKQKGLITLTENDVQKYSRLGIEDKYTARAYDYVLENNPEIVRALEKEAKEQGAKLPESTKINFSVMNALGKYYKGLDNLLGEAIEGLDSLKEYLENNPTFKNIILNEDGPHITKAIQNEISELEKRGAPLSLLEKAEGALSDASLRARYMEKIIYAQRVTISEWKWWARMSSLPEGFKYLLLEAVMTHNYDANLGKFQKRTSRTIRNLMPFDEGAVAQLAMSESDNLLKDYVEILIENSKKVIDAHTIKTDKDGGKWLKFDGEKTNPDTLKVEATALAQLVADTPWCTKDAAYDQLQGGDFYVYVTGPDSNGKFSPRIAVRMYEDRIGEVRGVASGSQDIETDMLPIAEDFMKNELANNGGQRYLDSIIYNKLVLMMREKLKSEKLTEQLIIGVNRVIQDERKYSVDYGENGNVERLKRDLKKKLSNPNELSDELIVEVNGKKRSTAANGYRELRPWTKILVQGNVHESDLDIDQGLKASDLNGITTLIGDFVATDELPVLPNLTRVIGNVYIVSGPGNLMNIKEITGTLKIGDGANVIKFGSLGNNIESVGGLTIGFNADIESLGSLQFINGEISMPVVKVEGSVFQGLKDLGQLKSIEGSNGGNRILMHNSVEKIEGLEYVEGDLSLKGKNIKSLGSIKTVTGRLSGILNPKFESLGELEEVGALDINFDYLTSLGNLKRITNGGLDIRSTYRLQSLGGLEYVGGDLTIRKTIDLGNLKEVNGDLVIDADIQSLGQLESVAGDLEFERITDAPLGPVDLGNLKTVGRDLIFDPYRLKSFGKLESVKRNLKLKSFRDENVKLPPIKLESVGSLTIESLLGFFEIPSIEINNFTGIGLNGFIELKGIKGLKTLITSDKKIDIPGDVEIVNCPDLESFGDIRSIGRHLSAERSPALKSLGNIEKIAGSITRFPSLIDLGKLSVFNTKDWEFYDNRFILANKLIKEGEKVEQVWNDVIGRVASTLRVPGMELIEIPIDLTPEEMAAIILSETNRELIKTREFTDEEARVPANAFNQLLKLNAQNVDTILGDTDSPVVAVRKQKMTRREIEERNFNAPPQSAAQELGHMYNMNSKGFIPKASDPSFFKRAVERLSGRLSTKKYHDERTGEFVGYSMTLDGKFFNPFYKVMGDERKPRAIRKQQFSATSNIYDIVTQAREARFTDRVIAAFLKERGYTATEIKEALAVPIDVFGAALPAGFANVEGGVAVGQDLFDSIMKKLKRYANAKRLGILLHTAAEVRMKAQELLLESEVFKKQSPAVQAEMQLGLDSALGIRAAQKKFQADFKALRAMLVNIRKGAAEMDKAKKAMRLFIRKNIPQSQYSKSDVSKLMKAIADSTPDTLPAVMERVTGFVNEFYVRDLQKAIAKLLETKTTTTRAGRRVGRMSVEAQNALGKLNSKEKPMLASEDMSPQQVEDMMKEQLKEFNELSSKTSLTESESARLSVLSLAMLYNESHLMEDNDPRKVEALNMVSQNLKSIIATGRAQMRNELDAQREYYNTLISEAFEGVTGEQLDLSPEGEEVNKDRVRELKNKERNKKVFNGKLKTFAGKVGAIVNDYFTKQMDLPLLMQRISSGVSGLLSTNLEEIFVNREFLARESYINGKKEVLSMVESKAKQIWGDNYNVEMQRNAVPVVSSDIVNDKNVIWLNQEKADSLKKEYASADKSRKKQIIKELEALQVVLSNNEAYYLYNQYKDPANAAAFEEKFSKLIKEFEEKFGKLSKNVADYPRIMQQIEARLDKKTKEWADWQVNVLYPSLYERYNEVYRAIYRTNMPWNEFYAGRIYREDAEGDVVFDLLKGTGEYQTSVGGQSTKLRVKNKRPIAYMDGNAVLNSYLKDMEYFRAYAEAMRDISKVLDNANVKAAIIDVAGKNTYDKLKDMMQKLAKKGVHQNESVAANKLMGNFIKSKLGLNPTVFLKQLTSSLAFADYIGFRNWTKYTALALPQAKQLWKEWYNNSPILQDRYESSNIGDVLEGYTYEAAVKGSPLLIDTKVFGKDIVLSQKNIRDAMNALMYLVRQGDKGGVMGGLANYLYYKEEFLKKNPGDEQGAARYAAIKATKQAITTQQDSGITNKDWYQTEGPVYRFLNVFLSSPKSLFRKEMSAVMSLYRKIKGLPTEDGYQDIARRVITFHVLVPMFYQWVVLGLPGLLSDWDDENEDALGRAAIMGNLNALFIIGDLFVGLKDLIEGNPWAGEFKTLPVFEQAGIVFQDIRRYSAAKTPEKKDKYFWRAINHMAEFTGVPASNIAKFMKNIEEIANGVSDPGEAILRLFNYSDYVISGGEKEKKSGSAMSEIDKKLLEARSIK